MTQQRRGAGRNFGAWLWALPATAADVLAGWGEGFREVGPGELRYPATIFVWVRWFICAACVFQLVYRPVFIGSRYTGYVLCFIVLVGSNGYIHYRVRSVRDVTLKWMLVLSALDVVLITVGTVVGGGFSHFFFYLLYYPALALVRCVLQFVRTELRLGDIGGRHLHHREPDRRGRTRFRSQRR